MQQIQHLHLLLRAECTTAPGPNDEQKIYNKVVNLVEDVKMKVFMEPKVVYMDYSGNEGLTALVGLETSHSSQHFWDKPNKDLLTYKDSTLCQFDMYTCGCMGENEIKAILKYIEEFEPRLVNLLVFDRSQHDSFDTPIIKIKYDVKSKTSYTKFLNKLKVDYTPKFKKKLQLVG